MIIRDATEADLAAVVRLLADDGIGAGREDDVDPLPDAYAQAFRDMQRQPDNRLIVAEDDAGAVVACMQLSFVCGISRKGAKRAILEGVRVDRRLRSAGLGATLVAYAVDEAKEAGCSLLQLTTDVKRVDARRFYERLGFISSHIGMKLEI